MLRQEIYIYLFFWKRFILTVWTIMLQCKQAQSYYLNILFSILVLLLPLLEAVPIWTGLWDREQAKLNKKQIFVLLLKCTVKHIIFFFIYFLDFQRLELIVCCTKYLLFLFGFIDMLVEHIYQYNIMTLHSVCQHTLAPNSPLPPHRL